MIGKKVNDRYGVSGIVMEEFKDFKAIPVDFINNKEEWLSLQEKKVTNKQLNEKWYCIYLDLGGSCLNSESMIHYDCIPQQNSR